MCVDADTDENNCGSCGNPCQSDEMCEAGICETRLLAYAPVPKTGQTISSYAIGDDGDLGKGVAWPNPRFTDNGDGTVSDVLTGLVWLKNANCFGARTWYQALSDCNELTDGVCGLTDGSIAGDWRLPNKNELSSLVDVSYHYPALSNTAGTAKWVEGDPFNNVQTSSYWLSSTYAYSADYAWVVDIHYGSMYNVSKSLIFLFVWPVRGGQ